MGAILELTSYAATPVGMIAVIAIGAAAYFAALGSVALLKSELDRQGIASKRRAGAGGCLAGGKPFSRGALGGADPERS